MARLGELEKTVMDIVWAAGEPMTARQVADTLAAAEPDRDLAYTTVLTVLGRLEAKGVLRRSRAARAHTYAAVATRETHTADLMREVLATAGDREATLARFAGAVSPAEAGVLRRALERLPES